MPHKAFIRHSALVDARHLLRRAQKAEANGHPQKAAQLATEARTIMDNANKFETRQR